MSRLPPPPDAGEALTAAVATVARARSATAQPVSAALAATPLLETRELSVRFHGRGGDVTAVDRVSYRLEAGGTLAIVGESGAGKTVSCLALLGLLPEAASVTGSARFDGAELIGLGEAGVRRHRGRHIAIVLQDAARALNPTMAVGEQIVEAVRAHERVARRAARRRAADLLRLLRLAEPERLLGAYPHQLSGGMRQRVLIAIALAARPRLLIADEITRSLDAITRARTVELLDDLRERLGMAVIMITHDLDLAAGFADDVLVMYAGRPVELLPAASLPAGARMPYTRALILATPRIERARVVAVRDAAGALPGSGARSGCAFEARCASARAVCASEVPVFAEHGRRHWYACWHPHVEVDGEEL